MSEPKLPSVEELAMELSPRVDTTAKNNLLAIGARATRRADLEYIVKRWGPCWVMREFDAFSTCDNEIKERTHDWCPACWARDELGKL